MIGNEDLVLPYIYVYLNTTKFNKLKLHKKEYLNFIGATSRKDVMKRFDPLHEIICRFSEIDKNDKSYLVNLKSDNHNIPINDKLFDLDKQKSYKDEIIIYGAISIDEFEKIRTNINKANTSLKRVLLFMFYYRMRVIKRTNSGDINTHPKVMYGHLNTLAAELNMGINALNKIIKYLEDIDIIRTTKLSNKIIPNESDQQVWFVGYTLFTDYYEIEDDSKLEQVTWEDELEYGKKVVMRREKKKYFGGY